MLGHLLRKAIKLTLQEPANATYRTFADTLLAIYHEANRVQRDGRLGDAGRAKKVAALDDRILALCEAPWFADLPKQDGPDDDWRRLVNELMRLMLARELFTFVTAPPITPPHGPPQLVAGTNNEAERTLRSAALARKTGRTSKTDIGARRQTILVSVLESLRCQLPCFSITSVIAELRRWHATGTSCFRERLAARNLALPAGDLSLLDLILPVPSG